MPAIQYLLKVSGFTPVHGTRYISSTVTVNINQTECMHELGYVLFFAHKLHMHYCNSTMKLTGTVLQSQQDTSHPLTASLQFH